MSQPERLPGGDPGSREEQQTQSPSTHLPANSSNSVEMDNLPPKSQDPSGASAAPGATSSTIADPAARDAQSAQQIPAPDNSEDIATSQNTETTAPSAKALGKAPATAAETKDPDAIGPADSQSEQSAPGELTVDILIIIPSTGNRHPFKINEKYLKKRNVNVTGVTEDGKVDPFSITVYTLKELVLREWRTEWETPPREPTSIRLIKMGKMLDDKATLSHEEEANKRLKEPSSRSGRSGCCVIL
ncbi:hypothetical protein LQW54_013191 [Pestalotiopsis sp. IQ-011]